MVGGVDLREHASFSRPCTSGFRGTLAVPRGQQRALAFPCQQHLAEHLRRLAALLLRAHRRRAFDQLVVIASSELWPAVEVVLHSDLRSRLVGLADLDLMDAPAQEIARAVAQHVQRDRTTYCGRSNRTGLAVPVAVSTTHHANTLVHA